MFYIQGTSTNVYCSSIVCLILRTHISSFIGLHFSIYMCVYTSCIFLLSCWSDPLLPDSGKQDSHHFVCHLVRRLPQVLLFHCLPLHPRWLHHCHPTCRQWLLPHSDLPPTRHHLQDWGGGCEERRRSRRTEGKGHGELHDHHHPRLSTHHHSLVLSQTFVVSVVYMQVHTCCMQVDMPS